MQFKIVHGSQYKKCSKLKAVRFLSTCWTSVINATMWLHNSSALKESVTRHLLLSHTSHTSRESVKHLTCVWLIVVLDGLHVHWGRLLLWLHAEGVKKHSDETSVTAGDLCPHYLISFSIAGKPGENGGEREDRAGAKQTEEALRRAEVFPKQRSSQGIAGVCHQVKECDIPTHLSMALSLNRVQKSLPFRLFKEAKAQIPCSLQLDIWLDNLVINIKVFQHMYLSRLSSIQQ